MKIEAEDSTTNQGDSCNLLRNWMTKSSDKSRKLHKGFMFLGLKVLGP